MSLRATHLYRTQFIPHYPKEQIVALVSNETQDTQLKMTLEGPDHWKCTFLLSRDVLIKMFCCLNTHSYFWEFSKVSHYAKVMLQQHCTAVILRHG